MPKNGAMTLLAPQDRSLEAYKAFINAMLKAMTGRTADEDDEPMTEEEWAEEWRGFWEKASQG